MFLTQKIYTILSYIAPPLVRLAGIFNDKIAEGIHARKGIKERWREKSRNLNGEKALIWFHVASVGEFLQAKPVISLLSEKLKGSVEVALTFYSPSGINLFDKFSRKEETEIINFVDYLPLDTPRNAQFCLKTLKPDMIIYVHSDLWPNLIVETSKLHIPQILISGTLSSSSKRLSTFAKSFYGHLYSLLDSIAAISDEDAERFMQYGQNRNIFTAGDTRFDQVLHRTNSSTAKLPDILTSTAGDFIIAGSTWPEDEKLVIRGFSQLFKDRPKLKLILVPHEPTLKRLGEIKTSLEGEKLGFHLLSSLQQATSITKPVIVADGVGYLADLYRFGFIAYIGGSFTTGVHNVMEPSVFSLPTLFGPRIDNSHEALELISLGAGKIVRTPDEFSDTIGEFLEDRKLLNETGKSAAEFIRSNRGASEKCFKLITKKLDLKAF